MRLMLLVCTAVKVMRYISRGLKRPILFFRHAVYNVMGVSIPEKGLKDTMSRFVSTWHFTLLSNFLHEI